MRILSFTLGLWVSSLLTAAAQLSVEVVADQDQYLRDESIPIKVRITNRSGQPLTLGTDTEWLVFSVDCVDRPTVARTGEPDILGEFTVESSQVGTRTVDLSSCFDFSQPGRYSITATVRIKKWNDQMSSRPKMVEVVRGTRIWEQEFGVPVEGSAPETRKFVLQQAHYLKRLELYARISDAADQRVFRVFPLGVLVSFSKPEAQVDRSSHLHVLFQTGARAFAYYVIDPDGQVTVRQTHDYAGSRPVLRVGDKGTIYVAGGARRQTVGDVPAAAAPGISLTNRPVSVPEVPATNAPPKKSKDAKSKSK